MALVLQMTKKLLSPPEPPSVAGICLRHYRGLADAEIWIELRRRAFANEKLGVGSWNSRLCPRVLGEELVEPPGDVVRRDRFAISGADGSGHRDACTTRRPARRTGGIHWLAVLPGWRRRGVGRLLVTTLEAKVWQAGHRQVWLETHAQWGEAARLYESLGYEPA